MCQYNSFEATQHLFESIPEIEGTIAYKIVLFVPSQNIFVGPCQSHFIYKPGLNKSEPAYTTFAVDKHIRMKEFGGGFHVFLEKRDAEVCVEDFESKRMLVVPVRVRREHLISVGNFNGYFGKRTAVFTYIEFQDDAQKMMNDLSASFD